MEQELPSVLRHKLSRREPVVRAEWEAVPAAVLIPLYLDGGEWHVLFTRRTDRLADHRGQVAFPGGRIEDEDAGPVPAALREAQEELDVAPEDVDVLGRLDSLLTVTQFLIAPAVGVIPWPYPIRPNPDEVALAFGVPLDWLRDPANLEMRRRKAIVPGQSVSVYYFTPYQGEVIWGVTARITLGLLELLKDWTPQRKQRGG